MSAIYLHIHQNILRDVRKFIRSFVWLLLSSLFFILSCSSYHVKDSLSKASNSKCIAYKFHPLLYGWHQKWYFTWKIHKSTENRISFPSQNRSNPLKTLPFDSFNRLIMSKSEKNAHSNITHNWKYSSFGFWLGRSRVFQFDGSGCPKEVICGCF